ncbi:MAG: hypothetical protein ACHP6H_02335, partial [Legionellales bacterium]
IVLPYIIFAQNPQSRLWTVPPNSLQFPSLTVNSLPNPGGSDYNQAQSSFANNTMHDPNGNLLFFIVDGNVYDRNGLLIGPIFSPSLGAAVTGVTEWAIIPVPGNCKQYYLVGGAYSRSNDLSNYPGGTPLPCYITLDLSLNNSNLSGNPNALGDFVNHSTDAHFLITNRIWIFSC